MTGLFYSSEIRARRIDAIPSDVSLFRGPQNQTTRVLNGVLIQDQQGNARTRLFLLENFAPPLLDPTPTTRVRMGSRRGGAKSMSGGCGREEKQLGGRGLVGLGKISIGLKIGNLKMERNSEMLMWKLRSKRMEVMKRQRISRLS